MANNDLWHPAASLHWMSLAKGDFADGALTGSVVIAVATRADPALALTKDACFDEPQVTLHGRERVGHAWRCTDQ